MRTQICLQLPETKNRTFEEISALFKPIQFGSSGGDGGAAAPFTDYGCVSLAGQTQQATANSPATPSGNQQQNIVPQGRFRFDSVATESFINEHQRPAENCSAHRASNQVCPDHCTLASSPQQGNLNHQHHHSTSSSHLPHNSCTSIHTQNLSTNDQQPLIVDTHYDHHCNQHDNHHHHQKQTNDCLKHQHLMTSSTIVASSNIYRTNSDGCCCFDPTTTTSFMAATTGGGGSQHQLKAQTNLVRDSNCLYCRKQIVLA